MSSSSPISVSIIIPTWNRASLIGETISSIVAQTYPHWELIIADDGSDDATETVVAGFADKRIRYLRLAHTGIGGKTKNAALRETTGDCIAFNDSDDLWHPEKLEKQLQALQQNPAAFFCLTGGYNFRSPGIAVEYFYKDASGVHCGFLFDAIFDSKIACFTQTLLVKRECLAKLIQFSEEGDFSDIDFIARLAYHFKGLVLFEPLLFRRLHAANYIHHNTWQSSYRQGAQLISDYRKQGLLNSSRARQAAFRLYINYGEKSLLHKKKLLALGCFFKAWRQQPFSSISFKKMVKALIR
ncbi:MAG: glycosyltransferase [Ferruginibacter sp.]